VNFVAHNKLAQGQYITVLDSDDIYKPTMFSEIEKIISNNDVDMLMTNYDY
jgi:putative aminopeptidase FrvX